MKEKIILICSGTIHYWASVSNQDAITCFSAGLTVIIDCLISKFSILRNKYNVIVWDALAHASSWLFDLILICLMRQNG